jgi:voltage-gated potassium channel
MALATAPSTDRGRTPLGRRWLFVALVGSIFFLLAGSGAAAALESDTVGTYWRGLWWATSLMTTVGFVGRPPATPAGAVLSAVLMIAGFLLLSLVSASLASIFVRDSERSFEREERTFERQLLARLDDIAGRLDSLEERLSGDPAAAQDLSGAPGDRRG